MEDFYSILYSLEGNESETQVLYGREEQIKKAVELLNEVRGDSDGEYRYEQA